MGEPKFTISHLARAAGVGVETIRYYQRRGLLPVPVAGGWTYRQYPPALAARIRFVKRAQELGFSLEEIGTLLRLNDGADRRSIRELAAERLEQIRGKLAALQRMEGMLDHLINVCAATGQAHPCPIVEALEGGEGAHGGHDPKGGPERAANGVAPTEQRAAKRLKKPPPRST